MMTVYYGDTTIHFYPYASIVINVIKQDSCLEQTRHAVIMWTRESIGGPVPSCTSSPLSWRGLSFLISSSNQTSLHLFHKPVCLNEYILEFSFRTKARLGSDKGREGISATCSNISAKLAVCHF